MVCMTLVQWDVRWKLTSSRHGENTSSWKNRCWRLIQPCWPLNQCSSKSTCIFYGEFCLCCSVLCFTSLLKVCVSYGSARLRLFLSLSCELESPKIGYVSFCCDIHLLQRFRIDMSEVNSKNRLTEGLHKYLFLERSKSIAWEKAELLLAAC